MKYLLILIAFSFLLEAKDTTAVYLNRDTLYYNWTILEDQPDDTKEMMLYNGNIFITGILPKSSKYYYSDDNFETWKQIKWINANDTIRGLSYCLLPNNNILVSGRYQVGITGGGAITGGAIKIYDIEKEEWETYSDTLFKEQIPQRIVAKDNDNWLLNTRDSNSAYIRNNIYETTNAGLNWTKIYQFQKGHRIENFKYFEKENILMVLIRDMNVEYIKRYITFSRDYGKSWTDLKDFPIEYKVEQTYYQYDEGYYLRNDSLWLVAPTKLGISWESANLFNSIYFSPDLGDTWRLLYKEIPPDNVSAISTIEFFDNSPCGIACDRYGAGLRLLITFDYGENWRKIADGVTNFGHHPANPYEYMELIKFGVLKADNKMIVQGWKNNRLFLMNNLNVPTGVAGEETIPDLNVYFDNMNNAIFINSNDREIIRKVDLFSVTGEKLYSGNNINRQEYSIAGDRVGNSKVVFAIIYTGNQMYLKKILCL